MNWANLVLLHKIALMFQLVLNIETFFSAWVKLNNQPLGKCGSVAHHSKLRSALES
jgi:hypothetical protein